MDDITSGVTYRHRRSSPGKGRGGGINVTNFIRFKFTGSPLFLPQKGSESGWMDEREGSIGHCRF